MQEATGSKINDTLPSNITAIMQQKREERSEKNVFQKISGLRTVPPCQKYLFIRFFEIEFRLKLKWVM